MPRIPWILLALAGCGRISFDGIGGVGGDGGVGSDGAGSDSAVCVPVDPHDEDRDGLADECDPCPTIAVVSPDSDGDGVGDLCDPAPGDPRETFTLIEGFAQPRADRWNYDTSTVAGDDMFITGTHIPALIAPAEAEIVRLQASVTPTGLGQRQIGVQVADTNLRRYFCEVFSDATQSYLSGTYTVDNVNYVTDSTPVPGLDTTGDVEVEMTNRLTTFSCHLSWNGMAYNTGPTTVPSQINIETVGIITNTVDAFVHNVLRIRVR